MISGVVESINLNDEADAVNTIWVSVIGKSRNLIKCSPLNMHIKNIPVLGEMVYLVKGPADTSSGTGNGDKYYYLTPIGIHRNINHNALQAFTELSSNGNSSGISQASAGVPSVSAGDSSVNFCIGFDESPSISQIQPFLGDVIFEGRFGQSIRFGYTPQGTTSGDNKVSPSSKEPSWTSTTPQSPITIIRNGAGDSAGYNKIVIEDINKDEASIWLGSTQKIGLTSSNKFTLGVTPASQYNKPQIILNSDRIVLNSKTDSVLISGKKSVNVSTTSWKADMDVMFTQIDAMNTQLTNLNTQMSTLVNTVNPLTGFALLPMVAQLSTISGKLVQITTELQLMKQ